MRTMKTVEQENIDRQWNAHMRREFIANAIVGAAILCLSILSFYVF